MTCHHHSAPVLEERIHHSLLFPFNAPVSLLLRCWWSLPPIGSARHYTVGSSMFLNQNALLSAHNLHLHGKNVQLIAAIIEIMSTTLQRSDRTNMSYCCARKSNPRVKAEKDLYIIHLFIGAASPKQCRIYCNKAAILPNKTKYSKLKKFGCTFWKGLFD